MDLPHPGNSPRRGENAEKRVGHLLRQHSFLCQREVTKPRQANQKIIGSQKTSSHIQGTRNQDHLRGQEQEPELSQELSQPAPD